jgi:hypothetical protein
MMHRPAVLSSILVASGVAACAGPARSAALATAPTGFADVNTDASLLSNGSVTASSPERLSTASALRREVYRPGGRVFAEQVHFRAEPDDDGKQASAASYIGSSLALAFQIAIPAQARPGEMLRHQTRHQEFADLSHGGWQLVVTSDAVR